MQIFVSHNMDTKDSAKFYIYLLYVCYFILSNVFAQIYVVERPKDVTVEEGTTAVIKCKFRHPITGCSWRKDGYYVRPMGRINYSVHVYDNGVQDCAIYIKKASAMHDNGYWKCSTFRSMAYYSLEMQPVRLTVVDALVKPEDPVIVFDNEEVTKDLHYPALNGELLCVSHRGSPAAQLHWEVDGRLIEYDAKLFTKRKVKDQSSLYDALLRMDLNKNKDTLERAREFKCVATHPTYGDSQREITLVDESVSEPLSNKESLPFWLIVIVIAIVVVIFIMLVAICVDSKSRTKKQPQQIQGEMSYFNYNDENVFNETSVETKSDDVNETHHDPLDEDPDQDEPFPDPPPPLPPSPSTKPSFLFGVYKNNNNNNNINNGNDD